MNVQKCIDLTKSMLGNPVQLGTDADGVPILGDSQKDLNIIQIRDEDNYDSVLKSKEEREGDTMASRKASLFISSHLYYFCNLLKESSVDEIDLGDHCTLESFLRCYGSNYRAHVDAIKEKKERQIGSESLIQLNRRPKRLKNVHAPNIGAVSSQAVIFLSEADAIEYKPMKVKSDHYPANTTGAGKCHLRSLFNIDEEKATKAIKDAVKHTDNAMVKHIAVLDNGSTFISIHRLNQEHWVSLTVDMYIDDQYYYPVKNFDLAREILGKLEDKDPDMRRVWCVAIHQVRQELWVTLFQLSHWANNLATT